MNLDFAFLTGASSPSFILKGFFFSVQLTLVAMVGGIALGTVLALMRLSGKKWLVLPAAFYVNTLRSIPLVMVILWFFLLIPLLIGRPMGAELSAIITFTVFEAAYYSEIMRAGIQSVPRGPGLRRLRGGHDLRAVHAAHRAAAGLSQHAAGAAHADHHPVPGHFAGLRDRCLRPAEGLRGRRQELQPAGRDLPASPRSSTSSSASACRCSCASCRRRSPSFAECQQDSP